MSAYTGSFVSGWHTLKSCISKEDCHMIQNGACTSSLDRGIWFLPLEWILNIEASQHSFQHVKTEVQNWAFYSDFSMEFNL